MTARVLVDGRPGAMVAPDDRGLAYGDGLFETLRVTHAGTPLWDRHLQRLMHGCARLAMPAPDPEALRRDVATLATPGQAQVMRITWTRGRGPRGYAPPLDPVCTRIVQASPAPVSNPDWSARGIRVRFCDTRLALQPALAGLKHLNRLEQVLARAEWRDADIVEGLMCDMQGDVICATAANLFACIHGRWITPGVGQCGVAGVARAEILAQWPGCETGTIKRDDLMQADEMFLCSSVRGILPVTDLAGRRLAIGADTRRIQAYFTTLLELHE